MAKLYCDANPTTVAYVLDGGDSGYQHLPVGYTAMEAEYIAIIYGLNEYFLKWNREIDSRQYDMTIDSQKESVVSEQSEFFDVGSVASRTQRELPPPILICSDNEVVVNQLLHNFHIGNDKLRKLAQQVWNMTKNIDVKFQWVPRAENPAGKILK